MRNRADDFVRRRIGDGDCLTGNGIAPFATNEKFDVGIGVHRGYLHDAADTAHAARPGEVNRIFLAGRNPASQLSQRGTGVWAFPAEVVDCRKRKRQCLY